MIGEVIVAGMDWAALAMIAAKSFVKGFIAKLIQLMPPTIGVPGLDAIGISGMASGGPVYGGTPYLVGERGPELFVPNSSGSISPNNQISGLGGQTITLINKVELDGRQIWQSVRQYSSAELRRLGGY